MPSFDAVNYSLRPNKAVERKIVFAGLQRLSRVVDLASHRYLGLGSLWFIDYMMAHKLLGIASMTSIERDNIGFMRAEYNCPLRCIEVIEGESSLIIPTLRLNESPSVVWLDYDSSINGPTIEDIGLLVPKCAANSVIIVTINAKKNELETKDESGVEIDAAESLRAIAGDLVPNPLPPKRLQPSHYPKLLCEILSNHFQSKTVNSGRSEAFIKLFDLSYADGTPMITVGGILASAEKADAIRALVASASWEGIADDTIAVPPLTAKEKMALDRMMPAAEAPTIQQIHKLGFALKAEQITVYHRYYQHYPVFGEFLG
jgi:hypothetical protein